MKTEKYEDRDAWLDARRGRITGTRAGGLLSKRNGAPLKGYWELVAERIALPPDGENAMDRGNRIEDDAVARFVEETKKKVNNDHVIWCRDEDRNIAISPDGVIGKTEAVEVKCLNSAAHIEAYVTKAIPSDYWPQVVQYFVVNDSLKKLYFIFYDPRIPGKAEFFFIEVTRDEVADDVGEYLAVQRKVLQQVSQIEKDLTF